MKYPDTLTLLRASGTDVYGNPGKSWASHTETTLRGFVTKQLLKSDAVISVLLPPNTDIRGDDRLRYLGATYEVGDVSEARTPSGVSKLTMVRATQSKAVSL